MVLECLTSVVLISSLFITSILGLQDYKDEIIGDTIFTKYLTVYEDSMTQEINLNYIYMTNSYNVYKIITDNEEFYQYRFILDDQLVSHKKVLSIDVLDTICFMDNTNNIIYIAKEKADDIKNIKIKCIFKWAIIFIAFNILFFILLFLIIPSIISLPRKEDKEKLNL